MAAQRERRSNAGGKMNQLLNAHEEDDFYETAYGGFGEETDDRSFASENEAPAASSDEFDTDVDTTDDEHIEQAAASSGDETNERALINEERATKRRDTKRRKAQFSAIVAKKPRGQDASDHESEELKRTDSNQKRSRKEGKESAALDIQKSGDQLATSSAGRSLRTATSEKRRALESKLNEERAAEIQRRHIRELATRKQGEVRRLTQAELLEEAKHTERENLKSLERFRLDELEYERARAKAKQALRRGTQSEAVIRVRSTTMRNNESHAATRAVSRTHCDAQTSTQFRSAELSPRGTEPETRATPDATRYEQTFVSFEGELADLAFDLAFACASADERRRAEMNRITHVRHLCPITGMQARYFDPLTLTPFANAHAFKILRMLYRRVVESGEKPLDLLKRFKQHALLLSQQQPTAVAQPTNAQVSQPQPQPQPQPRGTLVQPQRAPLIQPSVVRMPPTSQPNATRLLSHSAAATAAPTAISAVQRVNMPPAQSQRLPLAQNVGTQQRHIQPNAVAVQQVVQRGAAPPGRSQPQIINLTYSEKME